MYRSLALYQPTVLVFISRTKFLQDFNFGDGLDPPMVFADPGEDVRGSRLTAHGGDEACDAENSIPDLL